MAYNKRITKAQRKAIKNARRQVKHTGAVEAQRQVVALSRGGK